MLDNDVWDAAAQVRTANRWHSAAANWNSALTEALLDSANPRQSDLVVDVAAGSGDPALSIAERLRSGNDRDGQISSQPTALKATKRYDGSWIKTQIGPSGRASAALFQFQR